MHKTSSAECRPATRQGSSRPAWRDRRHQPDQHHAWPVERELGFARMFLSIPVCMMIDTLTPHTAARAPPRGRLDCSHHRRRLPRPRVRVGPRRQNRGASRQGRELPGQARRPAPARRGTHRAGDGGLPPHGRRPGPGAGRALHRRRPRRRARHVPAPASLRAADRVGDRVRLGRLQARRREASGDGEGIEHRVSLSCGWAGPLGKPAAVLFEQ